MNIHEYEYENSNEYSRNNKVSVASTVYSLDILYHKYYIFSRVSILQATPLLSETAAG